MRVNYYTHFFISKKVAKFLSKTLDKEKFWYIIKLAVDTREC